MKSQYLSRLLLLLVFTLTSCTTIVDSTTSEPIEPDPGKRSFGTYLDDQQLEVIAGVNIRKADPALKEANITVTSFNNILLLTGQVTDPALKQLAEQTAATVNTVRKVYNEIQVKGNIALLVKTNDTWLTAKVKAVFIADDIINSSKIKIEVEDGVLYLMGIMTNSEADYVTGVASNIGGVQEVVKVFEYVNSDS